MTIQARSPLPWRDVRVRDAELKWPGQRPLPGGGGRAARAQLLGQHAY
jgi:hypothetical protein